MTPVPKPDHSPGLTYRPARAMRTAILAQCLGVPWHYSLIFGGLATLYAQQFGARDFMIGLINGALMIGTLGALWGPDLVERYNKRAVLFTSALAGVVVGLPVLFLPQLAAAIGDPPTLWVRTVLMLLGAIFQSGFSASWFPIVRDFVPVLQIGRFFGTLRMAWQLVAMGLYLLFSLFLQGDGGASAASFQCILAVLLCGQIARLWLLPRLPQRPITTHHERGVFARLRLLFSEKAYRTYVIFCLLIRGGTVCIFPTLIVYGKLLGASDRMMLMAMLARMLGGSVSFPLWGRFVDRHGSGAAYRYGLLVVTASFLLWAPVTIVMLEGHPGGPLLLACALLLYGVGDSAINIGLTRNSFSLVSRDKAPTYLALQPALMLAWVGAGQVAVGWVFSRWRMQTLEQWLNPYLIGIALFAGVAMALMTLTPRVPGSGKPEQR